MNRIRKPAAGEVARYNFCWLCSKKLWGGRFVYYKDDDGSEHITHRTCAKDAVERVVSLFSDPFEEDNEGYD